MDPTTQRLLSGSGNPYVEEVILVTGGLGILKAFQWTDAGGWGTEYSDPGTLPAAAIYSVAFSLSKKAILVSSATSPFLNAYKWNDASGIGQKYTDPAAFPSLITIIARHPTTDQFCALVSGATDYVYEIEWDDATGFGTIAQGLNLSTDNPSGLSFSPNGTAIAISRNATPYIVVYAYSTSTKIGAQITTALPPDIAGDVSFNEAGNLITMNHRDSPAVAVATWNGSTIGTLRAPTGTAATTVASPGISFLTPGACVWGYPISPFIYGAPVNATTGVFGTLFSNPSTLPVNDVNSICFNSSYTVMFCTSVSSATSALAAYDWDDSTGFGAKYADPVSVTYPSNLTSVFALNGKNRRNGFA